MAISSRDHVKVAGLWVAEHSPADSVFAARRRLRHRAAAGHDPRRRLLTTARSPRLPPPLATRRRQYDLFARSSSRRGEKYTFFPTVFFALLCFCPGFCGIFTQIDPICTVFRRVASPPVAPASLDDGHLNSHHFGFLASFFYPIPCNCPERILQNIEKRRVAKYEKSLSFRASAHTGVGIRTPFLGKTDCHGS